MMALQRAIPSGDDDVMGVLRAGNNDLVAQLGTTLDVESGLREVLLRSDHSQQVKQLTKTLDIDAGLAAIVPSRSETFWSENAMWSLRETESGLEDPFDVAPEVRMALREDLAEAHETLAGAEEATAALRLVVTLAEELRELLSKGSSVVDFSAVLQTCLNLAGKVGEASTPFVDLTITIRETHHYTVELTTVSSAASDACRALEIARRAPHRSAKNSAGLTVRELQRMHTTALDDARRISYILLDRALLSWRTAIRIEREKRNSIRRALICRLDNDRFPALTAAGLRAFLDDFMYADLRKADLRGVDLTGVRWSVQTLWPAELDVNDLRERSVETPLGSGIFVVRSGTARMRQFATL
uniref:hypothetical protein n=1 Tax=Streptomyces flavovirens TaxID=52258 RepID=UPI00131DC08F|nr:hypothetical protein [Streptomyces flavovirens]